MAVEVKTHPDHPASMAERVTKRLNPSNDLKNADEVAHKGSSPNRTITSIHKSASHGTPLANRKTGSTGSGADGGDR